MSKTNNKLVFYLSPDQAAKLKHIRQFTTGLWAQGDPLHPLFTLHGPQHSEQVELIIGHILAPEHPEHHDLKDILNSEQLLYLLASAWLHDVGMIVPPSKEECQAAFEQGMSVPDWIREEHHRRSYEYIVRHASDLWLEPEEAAIIGEVCRAHRREDLRLLPSNYPNTKFLAAMLRVADELDITKARTPPQLMELRWSEMDTTSRWHWLKHWCVPWAEPYHEELRDESPTILRLTYQFIIRLSNPRHLVLFWERIIGPIREVAERQDVNLILRAKRLEVGYDRFTCSVQVCQDPLPDGTDFEKCLRDLLMVDATLTGEVEAHLRALRPRNPAAATMLQKQCQKLINVASQLPDAAAKIGNALNQCLGTLIASDSLAAIEDAYARFKEIGREVLREARCQKTVSADIEREWKILADLGWRLMSIVMGDEVARQNHLRRILWWLGTEANDLFGWVATKDPSPPLRQLAISALAKKGTADFYKVVLEATKDGDHSVRTEAVRALENLSGPGTFERLGQILDTDDDEEVRQTARVVLKALVDQSAAELQDFVGRKVLLVDDDRYVVSSVVDALESRGGQVRVETNATELQHILQDWTPDVVVCELLDVGATDLPTRFSFDDPPGLRLAKLVRGKLGPDVPIIATSVINPEEIVAQLASIRCVYVRKPTTVETFVRTIESLFPATAET